MKGIRYLYDIEVYRNYFCVGLKDVDTGEVLFYEISEDRDDRLEIYKFFKRFKGFLISFNGIEYDNVVVKYFIKLLDDQKDLIWSSICIYLKIFSDRVIRGDFDDVELRNIKWIKESWVNIDLYAYWSKMLRLSKKISLKSLGIQLGYPVVQELPFHPGSILKIEDLPAIRKYNSVHDLGVLELLMRNMNSDIELRSQIVSDFKLDCWSWDAIKIASETLLRDYCDSSGEQVNTIRKQRFDRNTIIVRDILEGFDPFYELPIFKQLYQSVLDSVNSFSKELHVNINNTNIKLQYGSGGLHSVNKNESYHTDEEYQVVTSDVTSLYPNLIINYHCIRYPEVLRRYSEIKDERVIAKAAKMKSKDTFFKLILNGTSGLLDNSHSWLYYPEGALRLRLIGQLILTKCIETCIQNNWQVVSANT